MYVESDFQNLFRNSAYQIESRLPDGVAKMQEEFGDIMEDLLKDLNSPQSVSQSDSTKINR